MPYLLVLSLLELSSLLAGFLLSALISKNTFTADSELVIAYFLRLRGWLPKLEQSWLIPLFSFP